MMKRMMRFVIAVACCASAFGGVADDGFLSTGEYEYAMITWRSYDPPLIVNGGGGTTIAMRDNGRLIVQSTSTPLVYDVSGVYDILLANSAQLLYLDGVTEMIWAGNNSKASLKGGSINYIKSTKYTSNGTDQNVDLYALPGWSWIDNDPLEGIQGQWWSGLPFRIEFINRDEIAGVDPVWMNIHVITPEPATLALLAFGGLLIGRKK